LTTPNGHQRTELTGLPRTSSGSMGGQAVSSTFTIARQYDPVDALDMLPYMAETGRWLKTGGALMLLACYVLPMSSCTPVRFDTLGAPAGPATEDVVTTKPAVAPKTPPPREYQYILGVDRSRPLGWVSILSFAIPAAAVFYTRKRPAVRAARVLWLVEPLLLAFVLVEVWSMTYLSQPEFGAYVAYGGLAALWAGWLGEAFLRIRSVFVPTRSLRLAGCASVPLAVLTVACMAAALGPDSLDTGVQIGLAVVLAIYVFILTSLGLNWMARRRRNVW
jgi:hypothetical protein